MSAIICHTAAASTLRLQGSARRVVLQSPDALSTLPGRFTDSAVCGPQDPYEMKTAFAQPASVRADWYVIDAKGKTLGRLASRIALRLKGKHKADYSPHVDMGDHIVVLNAEQIAVTGNKLDDKLYHRYTGYLGNLKTVALGKLLKEHPERAIEYAVKGMLPKNTLGRKMLRKLHVFAGDKHPHAAQQPKALELEL